MLVLKNILKYFSGQEDPVLKNLTLSIQQNEFLSLLGPSGCGKTTLLRIIAGLEQNYSGQIFLSSQDITSIPVQKRPFNFVFQNHALFPHLNVFENIAYGLKIKKTPTEVINRKVTDILHLVNLNGFEKRSIDSISGGQSQRIALARALVNEPQFLLLDEPLSALDKNLRQYMQTELKQIQKKLQIGFVFVTHDQEEAFTLSDRIALMNQGEIAQLSTPQELFDTPRNYFAAKFLGEFNFLPAEFVAQLLSKSASMVSLNGVLKNKNIAIRKDLIELKHESEKTQTSQLQDEFTFSALLVEQAFKGPLIELKFKVESTPALSYLRVVLPLINNQKLSTGKMYQLGFKLKDLKILDEEVSASTKEKSVQI